MSEAEFAELVAQVRHLGRLPKPVVVNRHGERYEIVDGEHGWRAARKAGLTEIVCEVIDVDTFEAMRQTYKRTQHGQHDPVRLGRMFTSMLEARKLSLRALASEIGISEGTVRNAVLFAEAADLRNCYAGGFNIGDTDAEIARLTVRQAREYVRLPAPIRDEWLDAGGDLKVLLKAVMVDFESPEGPHSLRLGGVDVEVDFWQELVDAGFAERVTATDFVDSAHEAFRLLFFRREHQHHVHHLDAYLRMAAELHAPSDVLGHLPCRTRDDRTEVLISPDQWAQVLSSCGKRAANRGELTALIRAALQVAVEDAGAGDDEVADPRLILAQRAVNRAPPFLRDAKLPLGEKYAFTMLLQRPDVSAEVRQDAVRFACEMLEEVRRAARAAPSEGSSSRPSPTVIRLLADPTPIRAFDLAVEEIAQRRLNAQRRDILADPGQLVAALAARLVADEHRRRLLTRLRQVPVAELRLLGAAAMGWPVDISAWMEDSEGSTEHSSSGVVEPARDRHRKARRSTNARRAIEAGS
jgi:hypothetical protein